MCNDDRDDAGRLGLLDRALCGACHLGYDDDDGYYIYYDDCCY